MSKNNLCFDALFTDVTDKGYGVCRAPDGRAVFVADALTDERASVKIIKEYKSYMIGRVDEFYELSPHRTDPNCDVYKRCGGCVYRHVDYETELELKRRGVCELLKRTLGADIAVPTPIHGNADGYRNKLLLPVGQKDGHLICGFYAAHSHVITECTACKLHTEDFTEVAQTLLRLLDGKKSYDERTGKGLIRHIFLRRNRRGDFAVSVIVNGRSLPNAEGIANALTEACPKVKSFFVNLNTTRGNTVTGPDWIHIKGGTYLEEELLGKTFRISPQSFFQVNTNMAEELFRTAARFADIKAGEVVFDMYCGTGTVGLCVCPDDAMLCGVEIVPQAIENARVNGRLNGRSEENTRFFACDAAEGFSRCHAAFGKKASTVLLDPPRGGVSAELIRLLAEEAPQKIVYISCNPATLARDLSLLTERGYNLADIATVDMFPRTAHVECVVLMTKELNRK